MNAPARLGPYQPVTDDVFSVDGTIAPIGKVILQGYSTADLLVGRVRATWTLPLMTAAELSDVEAGRFNARANLLDAVGRAFSRKPIDAETLQQATAAIERMSSRKGEDVNEWASTLANDLADFDD
jgi:hypothetical protein